MCGLWANYRFNWKTIADGRLIGGALATTYDFTIPKISPTNKDVGRRGMHLPFRSMETHIDCDRITVTLWHYPTAGLNIRVQHTKSSAQSHSCCLFEGTRELYVSKCIASIFHRSVLVQLDKRETRIKKKKKQHRRNKINIHSGLKR